MWTLEQVVNTFYNPESHNVYEEKDLERIKSLLVKPSGVTTWGQHEITNYVGPEVEWGDKARLLKENRESTGWFHLVLASPQHRGDKMFVLLCQVPNLPEDYRRRERIGEYRK